MASKKSSALKDINTPYFSYWQALYNAFYNPELYVDIGKRWKGMSVMYLFLLIFLVSIPLSIKNILYFNEFYNNQVLEPIKNLPQLVVQNGEVIFDKPMPFLIKNSSGQVVSIIDTTGSVTSFDSRYPDLSVLVTKTNLLYRSPPLFKYAGSKEMPVSSDAFDKGMNQVFDGKNWVQNSGVKTLQGFMTALIYPGTAFVFFVLYWGLLLTVSMLAQLMAKIIFKIDLTFGQAFRILMVGATPQIVLLMIIMTLGLMIPMQGIFMLVVLTAYFCFGVLSLKQAGNKLVLRD